MSEGADPRELLEHSGWLNALAGRLAHDGASSEDIVQETWLAYYQNQPPLLQRAWLAQVARRFSFRRRKYSRVAREREAIHAQGRTDVETSSPLERVARVELQQRVVQLVLELEEHRRDVVLEHFFEGRTCAEIARSSKVPATTIRTRLRRAMEDLRKALDEEFSGDRQAWRKLFVPFLPALPVPAASVSSSAQGSLLSVSRLRGMGAFLPVASILLLGLLWLGDLLTGSEVSRGEAELRLLGAGTPKIDRDPSVERSDLRKEVERFGRVRSRDGHLVREVQLALEGAEIQGSVTWPEPDRFRVRMKTSGAAFLSLRASGYREARVRVGEETERSLDIVLDYDSKIAGRVSSRDSWIPATGTMVTLRKTFDSGTVVRRVAVAADGSYLFEGLWPGHYAVNVDTTGTPHLAPDTALDVTLVPGEERSQVDFFLSGGSSVRGVLVTPSGEPVVNARISLSPGFVHAFDVVDFAAWSHAVEAPGSRVCVSNEQGRFEFDRLVRGRSYDVRVHHHRFATREPLSLRAGHGERTFVLERGYPVSGILVPRTAGDLSCMPTLVAADRHERAVPLMAESVEGNAFRFACVLPGTYRLEVCSHSRSSQEVLVEAPGVQGLEVSMHVSSHSVATGDGRSERLYWLQGKVRAALPLSPGGTLLLSPQVRGVRNVGAVQGQEVLEVATAEISESVFAQDVSSGPVRRTPIQVDGTFRLRVPSGSYQMIADVPGFSVSVSPEVVSVTDSNVTVETLELRPSCSVRGRLVNAEGQPVRGAHVTLHPRAQTFFLPFGRRAYHVQSDRNGTIEWEHVPAGQHEIVVRCPSMTRPPRMKIHVESGSHLDLDPLVLQPAASLRLDFAPEHAAWEKILVSGARGGSAWHEPGPDGVCVLDSLDAGPARLFVQFTGSRKGLCSQSVRVETFLVGGQTKTLRVEPRSGVEVSGVVHGISRGDIEHVLLLTHQEIEGPGARGLDFPAIQLTLVEVLGLFTGSLARSTVDANGEFRFLGVPDGRYLVQVYGPSDKVLKSCRVQVSGRDQRIEIGK